MLAEHQCYDFGMENKRFLGDGVVTGYGTVSGRKVSSIPRTLLCLAALLEGAWSENSLYFETGTRDNGSGDLPQRFGGARIQEGMDNVYGITQIFYQNVMIQE